MTYSKIRIPHKLCAGVLLICCVFGASAAERPAPEFGLGLPNQLSELPPGRLRSRIESLTPTARKLALLWLRRFEFTRQDLDNLSVDTEGAIYYSDTHTPDATAQTQPGLGPVTATVSSAEEAFGLHSKPGATKVLYLDFDGHLITGTAWNTGTGELHARPYDTDGSPETWGGTELNAIAEIWHRVSEDLAPFDIDVTTQEPAGFGPTIGRVLVTTDTDLDGLDMPAKGGGGVAYVNVFGSSNASFYSPALVYYNRLSNGWPPYVAEAVAHEFGHNLGLSHDGTTDGSAYYGGHGSGHVSWAPIMGIGYYKQVTEWSRGEYDLANNTQDDLAIIAAKLGYRLDDHGDSLATASALLLGPSGTITVSNPEDDPSNLEPSNKGVIDHEADQDLFLFNAGAGPVELTVSPAWNAYYRADRRGANLDILARLYDQYGNLLAVSDPLDETRAGIALEVPAGNYYLAVSGVGNSNTPYSSYGSLGMYFISGQIPVDTTDNTPPMPNPMGWRQTPQALSSDQIAMSAQTAIDESGVVEYQFQCVSDRPGCSTSAWQTSPDHVASGLAGHTDYSFTVVARDGSNNQTLPATTLTVTTSNGEPLAVDDGASVEQGQSVVIPVLLNDSDPDGDNLIITGTDLPDAGGVIINDDGTLGYSAPADYSGNISFGYTMSDGFGGGANATVTITIDQRLTAPPAPSGFAASIGNSGTVRLGWVDNSDNEEGFELQRQTQNLRRGTWRGSNSRTLEADSNQLEDPVRKATYRYRLRAFNTAGSSSWTPWAEINVSGGCSGRKWACLSGR